MKGIGLGLKMIGVFTSLTMLSMWAINTIGKDALILMFITVLSVGIATITEAIEGKL